MRPSIILCYALAAPSLVACAASDEYAEEDAAAAATDSGKGDTARFQIGPFTREPSYEGKEPLIAFFHAADGTEPDGETGQFDLVTLKDDESTHASGTFKLYEYQGRNRIRLTDGDGHVVMRSDWSYADGTLTLGEGNEMWQPNKLPEELVDCLVVDVVDNGVFEESLSTWEYPTVSVDKEAGDKYSLQIGGSGYDSTEATITVSAGTRTFEAVALQDGDKTIIRVPNKTPRRGEVLQKPSGGSEQLIAKIVCRP